MLVAGEPERSKVEPQPPADGGVGVASITPAPWWKPSAAVVGPLRTIRASAPVVLPECSAPWPGRATLGKCKEYRQVFGSTPRHHGVDGDGPHCLSRPDDLAAPSTFNGSHRSRRETPRFARVSAAHGVTVAPPTIEKVPAPSSMEPETTMSRAAGSPESSSCPPQIRPSSRRSHDRRPSLGTRRRFIGAHGVDMAFGHGERKAVGDLGQWRAWPSKPSQTIDTEGMPMDSAAMAAASRRACRSLNTPCRKRPHPRRASQIIGQSPDARPGRRGGCRRRRSRRCRR